MSQEKEENGTVLIFPLLKKSPQGEVDINEVNKKEIDNLARHYTEQILFNLRNHNIPLGSYNVEKDFNLVFESLKSAILRTVGKHHVMQDYVDHVHMMESKMDNS